MVVNVIPVTEGQDHTYIRGVLLNRQQTTDFLDMLCSNHNSTINSIKNRYHLTEYNFEQLLMLYEEGENKGVYDMFETLRLYQDNIIPGDTIRFYFLNLLDHPNTQMSSIGYPIYSIGCNTPNLSDKIYISSGGGGASDNCYRVNTLDNQLTQYLESTGAIHLPTNITMLCFISDI